MRVYAALGWSGGGWEVAGDPVGGLVYRRRGHDGAVLEENRVYPEPRAWERFQRRLAKIGVQSWEPRYEPEYPVCGGTAWAIRLGEQTVTGEDAYPPNWSEFLDALSELAGVRLE